MGAGATPRPRLVWVIVITSWQPAVPFIPTAGTSEAPAEDFHLPTARSTYGLIIHTVPQPYGGLQLLFPPSSAVP